MLGYFLAQSYTLFQKRKVWQNYFYCDNLEVGNSTDGPMGIAEKLGVYLPHTLEYVFPDVVIKRLWV